MPAATCRGLCRCGCPCAAHVAPVSHVTRNRFQLRVQCSTHAAIRLEVGCCSGKRLRWVGGGLVNRMNQKMESSGMRRLGDENLQLQRGGQAHVGAAVRQLGCGMEAQGEEGQTIPEDQIK
jgi:hypothetical protein